MNARIFGITWGTILFALILLWVGMKWGKNIPLLNKLA